MRQSDKWKRYGIGWAVGAVPVSWLALKLAPKFGKGFKGILRAIKEIPQHPFSIQWKDVKLNVVLLFLAIYTAIVLYAAMSQKDYRNEDGHGSAQWGSVRTIRKTYIDPKHPDENIIRTKHIAFGMSTERQFEYQRNLHTLVIGGSGASKTRGYVLPNLLQCAGSYLVLDPAGECLRDCGDFLKNTAGYDIRVLDLVNPNRSHRYNPFVYAKTEQDIVRMVEMFWKSTSDVKAAHTEQIWEDGPKILLMAICFFVHSFLLPQEQNFAMVEKLVSMLSGGDEPGEADLIFMALKKKHPEHLAVQFYDLYVHGADKSKQSIILSLNTKLYHSIMPGVKELGCTTEDEIGLANLCEKPTVYFVITPVQDKANNFFVSLLYAQMMDIIYRYCAEPEHPRVQVPFHFLMDEFANVAVPDGFDNILATIRKYGVSISIILQGLSQLKALYKDTWESIVGNCDTLLYLGGNDEVTAKYISEHIGKETVQVRTSGRSSGRGSSRSTNIQLIARDLITKDEVLKLNNKKAIVLIRGEDPILDKKFVLKKHRNHKKTALFDSSKRYQLVDRTEAERKKYSVGGMRIRTDLNEAQIRALEKPTISKKDKERIKKITFEFVDNKKTA